MKKRRVGSQRGDRLKATRPDEVWALDFQHDVTADGRQVRSLNVIDEFTREAFATRAARPLPRWRWAMDHGPLDKLVGDLALGFGFAGLFGSFSCSFVFDVADREPEQFGHRGIVEGSGRGS